MNKPLVATPSQTAGPFFHLGLPVHCGESTEPRGIRLRITVTDGDANPVEDALLELWNKATFARVHTGKGGACEMQLPPLNSVSAYLNVCVFARGLLRQLHTRIYFADPRPHDPLLGVVAEPRRMTLFAVPEDGDPGAWSFALRLQGPNETVFFDL